MVETVVAALRRSAIAVLKNLWLLAFQVVYVLAAPVLVGGGLGLPLLVWWVSHGMPSPQSLAADPLGFLISYWPVIVYAFIGGLIGFSLYLILWFYFNAGLTGVIGRAAGAGSAGAIPVEAAAFWQYGKAGYGPSVGIAGLSSLLILPPLVPLLALTVAVVLRLPGIITATRAEILGIILRFGIPIAFFALLFGLLSWFALVWYQYALCYSVVRGESSRRAMRSALGFFRRNWKPVLGLAAGALIISLLNSWVASLVGMFGHRLQALSGTLTMLLVYLALPVNWAIGIFMDIWFRSAVVVLFVDKSGTTEGGQTGEKV